MVGVGEGLMDVLNMTMAVDREASVTTSVVSTDVDTTDDVTSAEVGMEIL